jgi:hypothetical protein
MNRLEKLRKMLIYVRNDQQWWLAAKPVEELTERIGPVGPYWIDLTPRLDDGHFAVQDAEGIPQKDFGGTLGCVYNITRVCGYALANCDRYMHTGREENAEIFLRCARWLKTNAEVSDAHGLVVRYQYPHKGMNAGWISGMSQGQILSVFTRAYFLTGDKEWKSLAAQAGRVFSIPVDDGGVRAAFAAIGRDWYEEVPSEKSHILNGHIYALTGLQEAGEYLELPVFSKLYIYGLDALLESLSVFDCGYWSYYDYPPNRPLYVASYSYHLMHCILLDYLAKVHPDRKELLRVARRWYGYCNRWPCRFRAGLQMCWQKICHYR